MLLWLQDTITVVFSLLAFNVVLRAFVIKRNFFFRTRMYVKLETKLNWTSYLKPFSREIWLSITIWTILSSCVMHIIIKLHQRFFNKHNNSNHEVLNVLKGLCYQSKLIQILSFVCRLSVSVLRWDEISKSKHPSMYFIPDALSYGYGADAILFRVVVILFNCKKFQGTISEFARCYKRWNLQSLCYG